MESDDEEWLKKYELPWLPDSSFKSLHEPEFKEAFPESDENWDSPVSDSSIFSVSSIESRLQFPVVTDQDGRDVRKSMAHTSYKENWLESEEEICLKPDKNHGKPIFAKSKDNTCFLINQNSDDAISDLVTKREKNEKGMEARLNEILSLPVTRLLDSDDEDTKEYVDTSSVENITPGQGKPEVYKAFRKVKHTVYHPKHHNIGKCTDSLATFKNPENQNTVKSSSNTSVSSYTESKTVKTEFATVISGVGENGTDKEALAVNSSDLVEMYLQYGINPSKASLLADSALRLNQESMTRAPVRPERNFLSMHSDKQMPVIMTKRLGVTELSDVQEGEISLQFNDSDMMDLLLQMENGSVSFEDCSEGKDFISPGNSTDYHTVDSHSSSDNKSKKSMSEPQIARPSQIYDESRKESSLYQKSPKYNSSVHHRISEEESGYSSHPSFCTDSTATDKIPPTITEQKITQESDSVTPCQPNRKNNRKREETEEIVRKNQEMNIFKDEECYKSHQKLSSLPVISSDAPPKTDTPERDAVTSYEYYKESEGETKPTNRNEESVYEVSPSTTSCTNPMQRTDLKTDGNDRYPGEEHINTTIREQHTPDKCRKSSQKPKIDLDISARSHSYGPEKSMKWSQKTEHNREELSELEEKYQKMRERKRSNETIHIRNFPGGTQVANTDVTTLVARKEIPAEAQVSDIKRMSGKISPEAQIYKDSEPELQENPDIDSQTHKLVTCKSTKRRIAPEVPEKPRGFHSQSNTFKNPKLRIEAKEVSEFKEKLNKILGKKQKQEPSIEICTRDKTEYKDATNLTMSMHSNMKDDKISNECTTQIKKQIISDESPKYKPPENPDENQPQLIYESEVLTKPSGHKRGGELNIKETKDISRLKEIHKELQEKGLVQEVNSQMVKSLSKANSIPMPEDSKKIQTYTVTENVKSTVQKDSFCFPVLHNDSYSKDLAPANVDASRGKQDQLPSVNDRRIRNDSEQNQGLALTAINDFDPSDATMRHLVELIEEGEKFCQKYDTSEKSESSKLVTPVIYRETDESTKFEDEEIRLEETSHKESVLIEIGTTSRHRMKSDKGGSASNSDREINSKSGNSRKSSRDKFGEQEKFKSRKETPRRNRDRSLRYDDIGRIDLARCAEGYERNRDQESDSSTLISLDPVSDKICQSSKTVKPPNCEVEISYKKNKYGSNSRKEIKRPATPYVNIEAENDKEISESSGKAKIYEEFQGIRSSDIRIPVSRHNDVKTLHDDLQNTLEDISSKNAFLQTQNPQIIQVCSVTASSGSSKNPENSDNQIRTQQRRSSAVVVENKPSSTSRYLNSNISPHRENSRQEADCTHPRRSSQPEEGAERTVTADDQMRCLGMGKRYATSYGVISEKNDVKSSQLKQVKSSPARYNAYIREAAPYVQKRDPPRRVGEICEEEVTKSDQKSPDHRVTYPIPTDEQNRRQTTNLGLKSSPNTEKRTNDVKKVKSTPVEYRTYAREMVPCVQATHPPQSIDGGTQEYNVYIREEVPHVQTTIPSGREAETYERELANQPEVLNSSKKTEEPRATYPISTTEQNRATTQWRSKSFPNTGNRTSDVKKVKSTPVEYRTYVREMTPCVQVTHPPQSMIKGPVDRRAKSSTNTENETREVNPNLPQENKSSPKTHWIYVREMLPQVTHLQQDIVERPREEISNRTREQEAGTVSYEDTPRSTYSVPVQNQEPITGYIASSSLQTEKRSGEDKPNLPQSKHMTNKPVERWTYVKQMLPQVTHLSRLKAEQPVEQMPNQAKEIEPCKTSDDPPTTTYSIQNIQQNSGSTPNQRSKLLVNTDNGGRPQLEQAKRTPAGRWAYIREMVPNIQSKHPSQKIVNHSEKEICTQTNELESNTNSENTATITYIAPSAEQTPRTSDVPSNVPNLTQTKRTPLERWTYIREMVPNIQATSPSQKIAESPREVQSHQKRDLESDQPGTTYPVPTSQYKTKPSTEWRSKSSPNTGARSTYVKQVKSIPTQYRMHVRESIPHVQVTHPQKRIVERHGGEVSSQRKELVTESGDPTRTGHVPTAEQTRRPTTDWRSKSTPNTRTGPREANLVQIKQVTSTPVEHKTYTRERSQAQVTPPSQRIVERREQHTCHQAKKLESAAESVGQSRIQIPTTDQYKRPPTDRRTKSSPNAGREARDVKSNVPSLKQARSTPVEYTNIRETSPRFQVTHSLQRIAESPEGEISNKSKERPSVQQSEDPAKIRLTDAPRDQNEIPIDWTSESCPDNLKGAQVVYLPMRSVQSEKVRSTNEAEYTPISFIAEPQINWDQYVHQEAQIGSFCSQVSLFPNEGYAMNRIQWHQGMGSGENTQRGTLRNIAKKLLEVANDQCVFICDVVIFKKWSVKKFQQKDEVLGQQAAEVNEDESVNFMKDVVLVKTEPKTSEGILAKVEEQSLIPIAAKRLGSTDILLDTSPIPVLLEATADATGNVPSGYERKAVSDAAMQQPVIVRIERTNTVPILANTGTAQFSRQEEFLTKREAEKEEERGTRSNNNVCGVAPELKSTRVSPQTGSQVKCETKISQDHSKVDEVKTEPTAVTPYDLEVEREAKVPKSELSSIKKCKPKLVSSRESYINYIDKCIKSESESESGKVSSQPQTQNEQSTSEYGKEQRDPEASASETKLYVDFIKKVRSSGSFDYIVEVPENDYNEDNQSHRTHNLLVEEMAASFNKRGSTPATETASLTKLKLQGSKFKEGDASDGNAFPFKEQNLSEDAYGLKVKDRIVLSSRTDELPKILSDSQIKGFQPKIVGLSSSGEPYKMANRFSPIRSEDTTDHSTKPGATDCSKAASVAKRKSDQKQRVRSPAKAGVAVCLSSSDETANQPRESWSARKQRMSPKGKPDEHSRATCTSNFKTPLSPNKIRPEPWKLSKAGLSLSKSGSYSGYAADTESCHGPIIPCRVKTVTSQSVPQQVINIHEKKIKTAQDETLIQREQMKSKTPGTHKKDSFVAFIDHTLQSSPRADTEETNSDYNVPLNNAAHLNQGQINTKDRKKSKSGVIPHSQSPQYFSNESSLKAENINYPRIKPYYGHTRNPAVSAPKREPSIQRCDLRQADKRDSYITLTNQTFDSTNIQNAILVSNHVVSPAEQRPTAEGRTSPEYFIGGYIPSRQSTHRHVAENLELGTNTYKNSKTAPDSNKLSADDTYGRTSPAGKASSSKITPPDEVNASGRTSPYDRINMKRIRLTPSGHQISSVSKEALKNSAETKQSPDCPDRDLPTPTMVKRERLSKSSSGESVNTLKTCSCTHQSISAQALVLALNEVIKDDKLLNEQSPKPVRLPQQRFEVSRDGNRIRFVEICPDGNGLDIEFDYRLPEVIRKIRNPDTPIQQREYMNRELIEKYIPSLEKLTGRTGLTYTSVYELVHAGTKVTCALCRNR